MKNQRFQSPNAADCPQAANSNEPATGGVVRPKNARRRRLELRRLKSTSQKDDTISERDRRFRKRRLDSMKKPANESNSLADAESNRSEISLSPPPPSDQSSENDVTSGVTDRTSEQGEHSQLGARSSHGSISIIGRRRQMEDAVSVELKFASLQSGKLDFFGVYDGHGGSSVAHECRDRLHVVLAGEIGERSEGLQGEEWERVMVDCFGKVDDEVTGPLAAAKTVGSTAVVAVVAEDRVVVANCGDSRAVMCRGGVAVPLSNDHKPDRPDELERVEAAGGRVINWNGHRVLGVLATSRSIGDQYLKPYVISEPEVMVCDRTDEDEFLILATDGLWDVISNDVACQAVGKCLEGRMRRRNREATEEERREHGIEGEGRAAEAAAVLAELAMARGSKDNISVIVVDLRKKVNVFS